VGRTAGKIGRLVQRVDFISQLNERKFRRQIEINRCAEEVFSDILARLVISEELQDVLSDDVEALKQSNFDYQIKLLSKSLDEANTMISQLFEKLDKLENTPYRKFCRWIRLLFTV